MAGTVMEADKLFIQGMKFFRIRFGFDGAEHTTDGRCPDCGCFEGELHESGCASEQCPKCLDRLVKCGHG